MKHGHGSNVILSFINKYPRDCIAVYDSDTDVFHEKHTFCKNLYRTDSRFSFSLAALDKDKGFCKSEM